MTLVAIPTPLRDAVLTMKREFAQLERTCAGSVTTPEQLKASRKALKRLDGLSLQARKAIAP